MRKREHRTRGQSWEYEVGPMIRTLRKSRGLLLSDLATMTTLSTSFISQLERGLTRPSFYSLDLIAQALGTSARALLGVSDREEDRVVSVVRSQDALLIPKRTGSAHVLARGPHRLSPLLLVDGPTEFKQYIVHDAAAFMYVLDGEIEMDLAEDGIFRLTVGDSISFGRRIPHRMRKVGTHVCRILSVEEGTAAGATLDDLN